MKEIELRGGSRRPGPNGYRKSRGQEIVGYAKVDDDLHEEVAKYPWYKDNTGYARTNVRIEGLPGRPSMHHLVAKLRGAEVPPGHEIDHYDRDTVNNRSENLKVVSRADNNANQPRRKDNRSGFKGVSKTRMVGGQEYWKVQVQKGDLKFSKLFPLTDEGRREAARAVNEWYRVHYPDAQIPNPQVE